MTSNFFLFFLFYFPLVVDIFSRRFHNHFFWCQIALVVVMIYFQLIFQSVQTETSLLCFGCAIAVVAIIVDAVLIQIPNVCNARSSIIKWNIFRLSLILAAKMSSSFLANAISYFRKILFIFSFSIRFFRCTSG